MKRTPAGMFSRCTATSGYSAGKRRAIARYDSSMRRMRASGSGPGSGMSTLDSACSTIASSRWCLLGKW